MKKVEEIYEELNNSNSDLEPITNPVDIKIGDTLAAVYPSDKPGEVEYYRAKVIFIERKKDSKASFEVVLFYQRRKNSSNLLNQNFICIVL